LTCEQCQLEKKIALIDGQRCCSNCRAYMLECEARHLLTLPLWKRREQLDARLKPRGQASVEQLKTKMNEIFYANRKK